MLDSSLQYGIPQALIPPALIPPEKKKDWKDKLGQMLIQGDANWQPDDKTRRQMVKKGLLEAGLSMLANPSGYGNSPLIGISGGLLKGIGQMNNEADQLRGNQLNVNGNRLTDYQRKIQALQDPNTPEDVKQAIRISFGMDPRAINETWTSSLNPDGSLKASSNKGNVSILPVGQTTPQQFNLTGNPPPTAPAPPKPIVPTVTEVEAIGTQMLNNQIPPNEVNAWKAQQIALIQASQGMGNYGATQTQAPPVTQAPPSRIVTEQPTGGLPDTRKTETLTPYQSASLKLQQEASDRAKSAAEAKTAADAKGKPMPVGIFRLRDQLTSEIGTGNQIIATLDDSIKALESGKLKLGLADTASYKARNAAGFSTPESILFGNLFGDLTKQRNSSLSLQKGTQTEGDATRAWDEIATHLNDTAYVLERLKKISKWNKDAIATRQYQMQMIDAEYGGDNLPARNDGQAPAPTKERTYNPKTGKIE